MQIAALTIYPIKSCRGIAVTSAVVTATGLQHDRRWMLVDPAGRFVTQREQPRMALIAPKWRSVTGDNATLTVTAPGMPPLQLEDGTRDVAVSVTVWRDTVRAYDEGQAAAQWFSQFLRCPVRLVRFDPSTARYADSQWTGAVRATQQFADGFALLMLSTASLADLNMRLTTPMSMARFRPNLVVSGLPAYGEDALGDFGTAALRLRIVKPCTRCKITTIDPETGMVSGPEPLSMLATYRRDLALRGVTFGQNVIVIDGVGTTLQVGAPLVALPALHATGSPLT